MVMEGFICRRLRLNFQDRTILTKTQKKLGLKRSWILLYPHHHTIDDLISHIIQSFDLQDTCPHGIFLTMDGFALPPFESTIILKDNDIISVKRKVLCTNAIVEARPLIEDEIVEKQPLPSGVRLLANEEFDKENGGYKSETDVGEVEAEEHMQSAQGANVALKKRKASSPIASSKKKRLHQVTPKSAHKDTNHCENIKTPQKKKRKLVNGSNGEVTDKCTNNSEPKSNELEEKQEVIEASAAEKPSRRTLRKRMRRFKKKVGGANNNEQGEKQHAVEEHIKVSGLRNSVDTNTKELAEEDNEGDDDLVPVKIRPGHIRFASASEAKDVQNSQEANGWGVQEKREAGWAVQKNQEANEWDVNSNQNGSWGDQSAQKNSGANKNKAAKETFCWNGIKNKRKGQRWGKENQPSWKESRNYNGQSSNSRALMNQTTSSWKQPGDHNNQSSSSWTTKQKQPNDPSVEFDKLLPLIDTPKVGDVIAYRLLELSASWCPELSSFRVGKITSYDQETNNIMLVPEAEYPLNIKRKADNDQDDDDDDSGQPPQPSVYKDDGSLEIDFLSLVDVRVLKSCDPSHFGGTQVPCVNGTPSSSGLSKGTNQVDNGSKNGPSETGNQELHTSTVPVNGKKDVWEEISKALSAKKAQIQQEDAWNKKETPAKQSWSHKTLKSSALGPTMAMLRSQNGGLKRP